MDELIAKLNALKGRTIDENTIAELMKDSAQSDETTNSFRSTEDQKYSGTESCDDLIVASRAAELELESIRRYFSSNASSKRGGVDGLKDEDLSSDSEDEILNSTFASEKSYLDEVLTRNSLVTVADDDNQDSTTVEQPVPCDSIVSSETLDAIPTSVIVPSGARFIDLGRILSVVDGMYIIGTRPLSELASGEANPLELPPACDVETLVFLSDSEPLKVVGMVIDTLGTIENPYHLVLITQPEFRTGDFEKLIGHSVCTLDTHANIVQVDRVDGVIGIRGAPQLCDQEDEVDEDSD